MKSLISRSLRLLFCTAALVGCRVHTTYDSKATSECTTEATTGTTDLVLVRKRFDDCCHRKGLDSVEPGSQACGKLGLDALLK